MKRTQRGMVTVELAMVSLLVAGVVIFTVWILGALALLDQCQLTADEVARQVARGDGAAAQRVVAAAPGSASVSVVHAGGATVVTVVAQARIGSIAVAPLEARATVIDEAVS